MQLDGASPTTVKAQQYSLPFGESMRGHAHIVVGEEDVETNDEEEMTERLVAAWKKDVFPKIQQRFRNGSERVAGLAEIEGALRIKMYDIAEMQIDGLYEDSGGQRPPDLHLPTV
jgi:hypothetical protein